MPAATMCCGKLPCAAVDGSGLPLAATTRRRPMNSDLIVFDIAGDTAGRTG
jgi:hypothetical protein